MKDSLGTRFTDCVCLCNGWVHVWRLEDDLHRSVLYHMNAGDGTQVISSMASVHRWGRLTRRPPSPDTFHCNLHTPFQLDWLSSEVSGSAHFCPHYGCQAPKSSCLQSKPSEPSPQLPLQWGVPFTLIPKFSFTFRFLVKFA